MTLGKPYFDSGWRSISPGENTIIFDKQLKTTDVFVYMMGKTRMDGSPHQTDYGGYKDILGKYYGAFWHELTLKSIKVHRHGWGNWNYVRVMIWEVPEL